jgi:hypothetical protein
VVDAYLCSCDAGWEGDECELDIDECDAAPCQNAGACTDSRHPTCTKVDPLKTGSCALSANADGCTATVGLDASSDCTFAQVAFGAYDCACVDGFGGDTCENDIDECGPNPCANGDCTDGVFSYTCACADGWEGTNCATDTHECHVLEPCKNGGACAESSSDGGVAKGAYACTCAAGYEGTNCLTDTDECAENSGAGDCINGGVCTESNDVVAVRRAHATWSPRNARMKGTAVTT